MCLRVDHKKRKKEIHVTYNIEGNKCLKLIKNEELLLQIEQKKTIRIGSLSSLL